MRAFAFSCSFAPGRADDSAFVNEVVIPLLGDPGHKLKPQLRRLSFEAYTQATLDVQRRSSPGDEVDKPKKLPAPEQLSRLKAIKARLTRLTIEEELEPSHTLVDKFSTMYEEGTLRFVPWDELTRCDEEVRNVKRTKTWNTDSEGRLKFTEEPKEDPADTGSDLKLKAALQRRGIALEVAHLLTFEIHENYVGWLFKEYSRKAPMGLHQINVQQLHQVDVEVFTRLADATREGLSVLPDNTYALDSLLPTLMLDPRITMLMMP